jgi:chloride channel protein, CIC family
MAAYFSAIVRAPLTGVVLMVEMTGNYSLVLPLLTASLVAYGIADYLKDRPVYEALLERDMRRDQEVITQPGTMLLDLTIGHGALFDGRSIGDLELPEACLVVLLRRGIDEQVPTATTRLEAGDHLTFLISGHSVDTVRLLRFNAGVR